MPLRLRSAFLALAILFADQITKLWVLFGVDLPARGRVPVMPFMDAVMVWNRGISYGLFQQETLMGRWLLFALTLIACLFLALWLWRETQRVTSLALALILGGALGNGIDRAAYGAVVDFILLHAAGYEWYVFNIADATIVAGVALLLYGAFSAKDKASVNPDQLS